MQAEVGCRGAGAAGTTLCPRLRPENLLAVAGPAEAEEAGWGGEGLGEKQLLLLQKPQQRSGRSSRPQGGTLKLYKEPGAPE